MVSISHIIITVGIFISLALITGFIWGKKLLKDQISTSFREKYAISLVIGFVLYLITLLALIVVAFIFDLYLFGAALILLLIIPFIIGTFATFEKANFFVNMQVTTLFASFIIMFSMIGSIQQPVMNHHILTRNEVLSHFKQSICTMVRPYNQVFKRMVKVKTK